MTRLRRLFVGLLAVSLPVLAAAGIVSSRDLPVFASAGDGRLRGVFHVHSDASHDGRTPAAEQLSAAADLGLDFVVFTEHNLRIDYPDSPVLAAAGSEVSSNYGHLIQLGPAAVPERGFERSTIGMVDALHAQGALLVAAHPESPRRPWTGRVRNLDGFEVASTSTDARARAGSPGFGILWPLFAYLVNPGLGLAQLYRHDEAALSRWDRQADPAIHGFCGTDSHGWIDARWNFRTWQIVLDPRSGVSRPLTSDALQAHLEAGAFYCVAGLFADGPPPFEFVAETDAGLVTTGMTVDDGAVRRLRVTGPAWQRSAGSPPLTIRLLRDGNVIADTESAALDFPAPGPGTYRAEVWTRIPGVLFGGTSVPVVYSNRIRIARTRPGG